VRFDALEEFERALKRAIASDFNFAFGILFVKSLESFHIAAPAVVILENGIVEAPPSAPDFFGFQNRIPFYVSRCILHKLPALTK
jgi:hypothetical protein